MRYKLLVALTILFLSTGNEMKAQFIFGNTGLLHLPVADMQADATVQSGASYLNSHATPSRWDYNTYNYYIDFTFLPFLEVSYCMCLFSGDDMSGHGENPQHFDKWANQDRDFSFRLRVLQEGSLAKWTPGIVLGANDFLHTVGKDKTNGYVGFWSSGNGYWGRGYIALTKHFKTGDFGLLGVHAAYMYNEREDFSFNGPGIGVDFKPYLSSDCFVAKVLNHCDLRAEWDSRSFNIGFGCGCWKDRINFVAEMYGCRYFSCSLFFKYTPESR